MRIFSLSLVLYVTSVFFVSSTFLVAQNQGGGGGNNQNQNIGGIVIDGDGVVETARTKRMSKSSLERLQQAFAEEQEIPPEIIAQSEARRVSLKRVNQAVKQTLDAGNDVPTSLQYLAGLQRINYLLIDRENQDLVLVGPAEGFGPGPNNQVLGNTTGRPPMQLDDLVIALRSTFSGNREIGVSIDPTNENMAKLQNYIRNNSNPTSTSNAQKRYRMMGRILDKQVISLWGVPKDSHFAVALVEADLKMKQISLGTIPSNVREVRSHLALLRPQGNSLQRWWFMPYYESLGTNEERSVFEIKGQRAQLMAQEEKVGPGGQRQNAAFTRLTTEKFAQQFTEHFEKLANVNPAFAELQNLYDLALIAALTRKEWPEAERNASLQTLLRDDRLPLQTYQEPKFVPSASTYRKSSQGLLIGLIGGVTMDLGEVVDNTETRNELNDESEFTQSDNAQWWWNPTNDSSSAPQQTQ